MYKQAYLLGDMLYKGSQLIRAQEAEELRAINVPLYSAAEQNKDGDINDKKNQTEQSNNDLHAHIFKKDVDNIMASDLIIANPERFAEGSICELGAVEMFNYIHQVMSDIILNPNLRDGQKVDLIQEWLEQNPYKKVYVHMADIRCTEINEHGMNRSFGVNQFVRGCAVAAQTGVRGVPVSQGGIDMMSWEEVIEHLKDDMKEQESEFDIVGHKECVEDEVIVDVDGFAVFPLSAETDGIINDIEDLIDLLMNDISDIECLDDGEISLDDIAVGDKVVLKTMDEMLEDGAEFENGNINFPDESTGFSVIPGMFEYLGKEFVVDGVLHNGVLHDLVYDMDDEEIIEKYYSLMAHDGTSLDYGFTKPMIKKVIRG